MARSKKMRQGECRTTKTGMEYCKLPQGVRFTGQVGRSRSRARGRNLSGRSRSGRGSATKGKKCQRFKRVNVKGTTAKQRRCASYK